MCVVAGGRWEAKDGQEGGERAEQWQQEEEDEEEAEGKRGEERCWGRAAAAAEEGEGLVLGEEKGARGSKGRRWE